MTPFPDGPRRGPSSSAASGGYGAGVAHRGRVSGAGAGTLGVSFEKAPRRKKTATAGWYNNAAFEDAAAARGLYARTLDGDAYSDEMKAPRRR